MYRRESLDAWIRAQELADSHGRLVLTTKYGNAIAAKWLGHSSPTITLDHYAHFMPEAGKKGRRAIDSLLGEREEEVPGANSPDSPQAPS
jgi:integrase